MLYFSATVADQIRYLLQSCNDSNFDSVLLQLCEFAEYGSEGNVLLLQTCLDQIDFHGMNTNVLVKPEIICSLLRFLMGRPNFSTVFCEASKNAVSDDTFLESLSKALNLSIFEKFGVSLALADSENLELSGRGQSFCISLIEELCENSTSIFSHELIRDVVMFLYRSEGLSKHVDSFTKILSLLDTNESLPFLLSPLLSGDLHDVDSTRHLGLFDACSQNDFDVILLEIEKEKSMADIMGELGYGCTVDTSRCVDMLSLFLPLTEVTIAKLLGTIIRTRVGHEDNLNLYSTFATAFGCNAVSDTSLTTWNIDVLVDSIKKLAPATNWIHVFENLDQESFYIPDDESFSFFMSFYSYTCQNPFPLYAICGHVWKNAEGQLSFLRHAVSAPPEVFTFAHSERKLSNTDSIYDPSCYGNQTWNSLVLLDILCELAERGHAVAVREMLEHPIKECPDLLLLGIVHSQTAYNFLQYEVFTTLFPDVLKKSKNVLISDLWHANSSLVLHGFLHSYSMDTENIWRILSICEELKILSCILESSPLSFSIRLAAIASQKELIDLEKWLDENFLEHKDALFKVALQFLKDNLANAKTGIPRDTSDTFESSNISQDSCKKVLKAFQVHLGKISSPQLSEEVKKFYSSTLDLGKQSAEVIEMSAEGTTDDVETEANTYFHQMFSGQLSIDTMIQTLGRFKEYTDDKREKRIFDCMIGNLFEEYKFFPTYPDRQLKIAAVLFGSLIKHQLVTHITLGIALRCVLEALRKSVDSKMFQFGAKALEQFRERLVEWPQYCNHILQISHLRSTHSELVLFIERALARISSSQLDSNAASSLTTEHVQSSLPVSVENVEVLQSGIPYSSSLHLQQRNQDHVDDRVKSTPLINRVKPISSSSAFDSAINQKATSGQSLQASQPSSGVSTATTSSPGFARPRVTAPTGLLRQSYSTGFGAALNIETLVAAAERRDSPIEAPASEIQDKIHFIINNISTANVDTKAKEFVDVLKEEYFPWFAEYMVMKRASIEPNFHDLYLKFLEKVSSRSLNKEIVKATYENCKVLLRSDLIKSSSEERSLLKNLGSWLGKFTIGRNQALRAREIDPKFLIMEAYEKGLMIAVVPFTSKILEPCQCSLAYQPPNPWTMAILGLLVEIYNLPNLKMNLKFDIEVLFKNLGVDMKDVKPTSLLKDRIREVEGNPDFSNKDISTSQTQIIAESNSALISPLNQFEVQSQVTNASHPGGHPSGLRQYNGPLHVSLSTIEDEDKSGSLSISERGLSGLGQPHVTASASPYTVTQLLTPISNISSHIVINTKLSAMGFQMHLQRIIPLAMERAVAEIISAVVTRSVTISLQTTKELVQKDYSMETDENRIRNAAKLMVSSLAGSLAHVTCKEPLRMSLSNHLRSLLQPLHGGGELLDQTILIITNDNLDLGCALVEQSATEKALQNIEGDVSQFIALKKKQRESSGSYYDAAAYAQGTFARVPESLRPKPGRLSNNQQRVYEEFVKYPWHNQCSQNSSVNSTSVQLSSSGGSLNSTLARGYGSTSGQQHPGIYTVSSSASVLVGAQSSDFVSDVIDSNSMQILSVPPTITAADDVSVNQAAETISTVPSYPSELLITDSFPATKDLGTVVPPATAVTEHTGVPVTEPSTLEDVLDKYHVLAQKLENLILPKDPRESDVQNLYQEVAMELHETLLKCTNRNEAALSVSQKIFKRLYENASNSLQVGAHLALLGAVRDICQPVVKEITNWVVFSDEEWKFNKDITIGLIQTELLSLEDYDVHLAKLIDSGRNRAALAFVISLLQALLNQRPGCNLSEFYNLMDVLTKLSLRPGCPDSVHQLIDMTKNSISDMVSLPGTNTNREERNKQMGDNGAVFVRSVSNMEECISSDSLVADPASFHEQASLLFAEWFRICESPTSDVAATHFISQLQQSGFLKGDELTERFLRVIIEISVLHCLASEQMTHSQQPQILSFAAIDIFAKLVCLILKYFLVDLGSSKISLLPKILSVVAKAIQKDAEDKKTSFNPRPYFRLLLVLIMDLNSPDFVIDGGSFQVLTYFANILHALQPAKVPSFSYAWLDLVSNRCFMPKLLMVNGQMGWPFFHRLLVDMLKFIEPYLRNANLRESVLFLYKGILRMLLVLLHDFPEFLCDYHFSLCDVIPSTCIQMRNIILSAFPVNMRLPDPCTPNLKIDLLPEITQSPRFLSDIDGALKSKQIKTDVDEYLMTRNQGSFLTDLKQRLLLPTYEVQLSGTRYNVPLINSLVLYVGMQAVQHLQNNVSSQQVPTQGAHSGTMDIFLVSAAMDIFNHLMQDLDAEGRYIFLNAVANQLRYPNNHTHYFSFILLYLFVEAREEIIQEQITRVLLERLIVNRPHPWGLLITFIELIKNPRYDFWSKQFIRCAPEIENLFEQVSRSCGGSRGVVDDLVSIGLPSGVH